MQRVVRLQSALRPALCSPRRHVLRSSSRLYSTPADSDDSNTPSSSSTSPSIPPPIEWPAGITQEMVDRARRNIDMDEIYAEADAELEGMEIEVEGAKGTPSAEDLEQAYDFDTTLEEDKGDDSTSVGHRMLMSRRELLQYFRLIELEMPTLHALRKPFVPPSPTAHPIIARTLSYSGLEHPVQRKAALVVPLSKLPLKDAAAMHKFKLLAGTRWTIEPPKDAGLAKEEMQAEASKDSLQRHGYFKISHEAFPELSMNLKWCSDTLDQLLVEANTSTETFADIPLDTRHMASQAHKRRKGQQRLTADGSEAKRPSIADFPQEWLPSAGQVRKLKKHLAKKEKEAASRGATSLLHREIVVEVQQAEQTQTA